MRKMDSLSLGERITGRKFIDMIVDTTPDIVLLDLVMPKVDGIYGQEAGTKERFPEKSGLYYTERGRGRAK